MDAPSPSAPTPSAPMSGLVYGDVPNRVIAIFIDGVILLVLLIIVGIILAAIGLATSGGSAVGSIVGAIVGLAVGGGYFVYTWTSMRATVGMRLLGMQIGNAGDGRTLTMEQAVRRYLALAGPGVIANFFAGFPAIGVLLSLLSLGWVIYLLYTTAQSPTKQGWHDVFANTQVVKAAKSV
jgi:uncharacterized RDD family membrane protein YckC